MSLFLYEGKEMADLEELLIKLNAETGDMGAIEKASEALTSLQQSMEKLASDDGKKIENAFDKVKHGAESLEKADGATGTIDGFADSLERLNKIDLDPKKFTALASSIQKLGKVSTDIAKLGAVTQDMVKAGEGLAGISKGFEEISKVNIDSAKFTAFKDAIKGMSDAKSLDGLSRVSQEISKFADMSEQELGGAVSKIQTATTLLSKCFEAIPDGKKLAQTATGLATLVGTFQKLDKEVNLDKTTDQMQKLQDILISFSNTKTGKLSGELEGLGKELNGIAAIIRTLGKDGDVSTDAVDRIVMSLANLSQIAQNLQGVNVAVNSIKGLINTLGTLNGNVNPTPLFQVVWALQQLQSIKDLNLKGITSSIHQVRAAIQEINELTKGKVKIGRAHV